ncbi:indolepyruvate ferredoxin oxidoreductase subunit alpha [Mangrovibacterium marinum]|uniref:Indolepyruvate oxidoreductase subunit IorA n=1 Tax=Mangrovibacterium marinum TaxID=1639118 RepID=A0A2T5BRX6_9BACT|nr:indolepyruvate ferredoxin oxidoreductase subunit alpha [Mangrovibacterium marinum]PTN02048.1 indolepyruvate ferredoxin oxidoreductase alpha subunit [Mangrovibacterium marinum]
MKRHLFLGNEAVAQAAIDAGISGAYAYPGTPSTEIMEYIQHSPTAEERAVHRQWSANEKTAYETALGMSYAGRRALVCMKQVGLNVAADAFINSAITGVNGGLVLAVADDPGMHSSQNEQDSRYYGRFAMIPVLEPSNQQEAYDMCYTAFKLSEQLQLPVMLRLTTRLSHSRAAVSLRQSVHPHELHLPQNLKQFLLLPIFARKNYVGLLEKQHRMEALSEQSSYNFQEAGVHRHLGIVCCGLGWNYFREVFVGREIPWPRVKIGQYPLPRNLLEKLEAECDELLVIEEGYPMVEEQLRGFFAAGKPVHGKLDGWLPRYGELTSDQVGRALQITYPAPYPVPEVVVPRPPSFCRGCGHVDAFEALQEVVAGYGAGHIFSDIGCYALAALPPYQGIYSCVDMGASITMAKGAADAGFFPAVAFIGDSTFTHSGMTGLLDAVNEHTNMVVVISDNQCVAMTGGQQPAGLGKLEAICEGLGVDPAHIRVFTPLHKNQEDMIRIYQEEIEYDGLSVVIPRRECLQKATRRRRQEKQKQAKN